MPHLDRSPSSASTANTNITQQTNSVTVNAWLGLPITPELWLTQLERAQSQCNAAPLPPASMATASSQACHLLLVLGPADIKQLALGHWQQMDGPYHALADYLLQQLTANTLEAAQSQRFEWQQGKVRLDVHYLPAPELLRQIMTPTQQRVSRWFWQQTDTNWLQACHLWQLARLSEDDAVICYQDNLLTAPLTQANLPQFRLELVSATDAQMMTSEAPDAFSLEQRQVLRRQHQAQLGHVPINPGSGRIAIIGGGLASAQLAYSLASRQRAFSLFCEDEQLAMAASGNRQGALYPLLTPEHDLLSRFYQHGFLLSRQRLAQIHGSYPVSHEFCGVLQTPHDARSAERLQALAEANFPAQLVSACSATKANALANIAIDNNGLWYPNGGWIAPAELTAACMQAAGDFATVHLGHSVTDIQQRQDGWYLNVGNQQHGPFEQLILANGTGINQFADTKAQALSPFRGQVSHVPSTATLTALNTVLCAKGYFTPCHNKHHCLGASYIKNPRTLDYSDSEQVANLGQLQTSYPNQTWVDDVDISEQDARVGVRMVSRDHFPVVGLATDVEALKRLESDQHFSQGDKQAMADFWQQQTAPTISGLYLLGGLGSRGLCNGALAAEMLASQLCGEFLPCQQAMVEMLMPNRLWLRKLIRGKQIKW